MKINYSIPRRDLELAIRDMRHVVCTIEEVRHGCGPEYLRVMYQGHTREVLINLEEASVDLWEYDIGLVSRVLDALDLDIQWSQPAVEPKR